jgi:hypothetical protein
MLRQLLLLVSLFALGETAAQYSWYEPGSWQESQLIITRDAINTNRFAPRVWMPLSAKIGLTDTIAASHGAVRGITFSPYFKTDNPESADNKEQKNGFFTRKGMFYSWSDNQSKDRSTLVINPIINLGVGVAGYDKPLMHNGRGIEVRGNIKQKLGFYTRVTENQTYFPEYVNRYRDTFGVAPGLAWWKGIGKNGGTASLGTDYLQSVGYISAALINNATSSNYLIMGAGHDRFFIGQGYRSLILGNASAPFGFLKFNTKIGPFQYQNIYGQLNGYTPLTGNTLLPKKYLTMHRGSLEFEGDYNTLEIGFSEMIIHHREQGNFDLDYLNPIIFYRSIEANAGSKDNAMMAFDVAYKLPFRWRFYGQAVLDEFKLNEVKKGGWWANKFGWQLGLMRIIRGRLGNGLVQVERNQVRPYTYSHSDPLNSYTHYNQPLAHPLGSNFQEWCMRGFFQPKSMDKLRFQWAGMLAKQGNDPWTGGLNYGANPRRDNDFRVADNGVQMLQGLASEIQSFRLDMAYMVYHNLNLDFGLQWRKETGLYQSNATWIHAGLRWNIEPINNLF